MQTKITSTDTITIASAGSLSSFFTFRLLVWKAPIKSEGQGQTCQDAGSAGSLRVPSLKSTVF